MKTRYLSQIRFLIFLLSFLLNGCNAPVTSLPVSLTPQVLPSDTQQNTPSQKQATPTPTHTKALTPTSTPVPPTWTPRPTLNLEEARAMVDHLFETDTGCRLPCWWGIMPGQTSWGEAEPFLSQIALYIGKLEQDSENQFYINIKAPPPTSSIDSAWRDLNYLSQDYLITEGVVEIIEVYNFDLIQAYYLPAFLKTYGQPDEIWIRTFSKEEQNSQPFLLDLFYPTQGILMEYSGGRIIDLGDRLQHCSEEMNAPFIYLWSPKYKMTFDEAKTRFLDTENLPEPVRLEIATGMDAQTYYESIVTSGTVCIETPKEIWP